MGSATSQPDRRPDVVTTTLRVQPDLLRRFTDMAVAHQRSVNQELRWVMAQAVEDHENERAA